MQCLSWLWQTMQNARNKSRLCGLLPKPKSLSNAGNVRWLLVLLCWECSQLLPGFLHTLLLHLVLCSCKFWSHLWQKEPAHQLDAVHILKSEDNWYCVNVDVCHGYPVARTWMGQACNLRDITKPPAMLASQKPVVSKKIQLEKTTPLAWALAAIWNNTPAGMPA